MATQKLPLMSSSSSMRTKSTSSSQGSSSAPGLTRNSHTLSTMIAKLGNVGLVFLLAFDDRMQMRQSGVHFHGNMEKNVQFGDHETISASELITFKTFFMCEDGATGAQRGGGPGTKAHSEPFEMTNINTDPFCAHDSATASVFHFVP